MGRHFLAAKANWDFLPNLPFLPILLDVLIVAFSFGLHGKVAIRVT
jgi:hypothetical protein